MEMTNLFCTVINHHQPGRAGDGSSFCLSSGLASHSLFGRPQTIRQYVLSLQESLPWRQYVLSSVSIAPADALFSTATSSVVIPVHATALNQPRQYVLSATAGAFTNQRLVNRILCSTTSTHPTSDRRSKRQYVLSSRTRLSRRQYVLSASSTGLPSTPPPGISRTPHKHRQKPAHPLKPPRNPRGFLLPDQYSNFARLGQPGSDGRSAFGERK